MDVLIRRAERGNGLDMRILYTQPEEPFLGECLHVGAIVTDWAGRHGGAAIMEAQVTGDVMRLPEVAADTEEQLHRRTLNTQLTEIALTGLGFLGKSPMDHFVGRYFSQSALYYDRRLATPDAALRRHARRQQKIMRRSLLKFVHRESFPGKN